MSRVIVRVGYGDFWVDDLPSAAVDLQVLSRVHSAMMLASLQNRAGIEVTESNDSILKDFPLVCVEWGKEVDYQYAIKIPEGTYRVETSPDGPRIIAFMPTGNPRGVSFPVSYIGGRRSRQKMYDKRPARTDKRQSVWDVITRAIEAFNDRVEIVIRKEESGETSVTVFDRTSNQEIVWYRYLGNRKLDQGGTCLSGSEKILSPFAVVAAYYQMLDTNRTVAEGVVVFQ